VNRTAPDAGPGALVDAGTVGSTPDAGSGSGDGGGAEADGGVGVPAPTGCATTGVQDLVTADTTFALAFFPPASALAGGAGSNVVLSPYGVSAAMMMVDVGAAGETASQIETVLDLTASGAAEAAAYAALACTTQAHGSADGNALYVANSLWGQQGAAFEMPFLNVLSQGYGAALQTVDFEGDPGGATTTINGWVSQETQGNVPSLLDSSDVTTFTHLVLVNALYFKGIWATGFDPSKTAPETFTRGDGTQETVPTMSGTIQARSSQSSKLVVLELPYKGSGVAMDILMPVGASSDLTSFESALTPTTLGTALGSLGASTWLTVDLPKFSFTTRVELASALKTMGIVDAFVVGTADLSGMDGAKDLSVGAVVQEARVEVDEQGTVAAAGTGVSVCSNCLAITEPSNVFIDHPFVFLVRDTQTGAIVFMGQVVDPSM
jgi:serpin B